MNIEINPAGIAQSYAGQAVSRAGQTTSALADTASFPTFDSLQQQLSQISLVRPEQVAKGQALVADDSYPPDYILKRIPILLGLVQRR